MVLKNLFAGHQWRNRHREQTVDMGRGEERMRCMGRVTWKLTICKIDQFRSATQSCPTLCNPMDCSMPGLPVHHQVPEFTQTHVH